MDYNQELKELIETHIDMCCPDKLPFVKELVKTNERVENLKATIFEKCSTRGISVQTAMSEIESSLEDASMNYFDNDDKIEDL